MGSAKKAATAAVENAEDKAKQKHPGTITAVNLLPARKAKA